MVEYTTATSQQMSGYVSRHTVQLTSGVARPEGGKEPAAKHVQQLSVCQGTQRMVPGG